jgi:phenol 2-monooxygenase
MTGSVLNLALEMPSIGRYHILILTSNDLLDKSGASQSAMTSSINTIQRFAKDTIGLVVLHPLKDRFEWTDLPADLKKVAEMSIYGQARNEDVYEAYGVSKDQGVIAVVRPDGYIGTMAPLLGAKVVEAYFRGCLISN